MSVVHFDLPFRFNTRSHADTVEQDTIKDVANCVVAAVLTEPGFRTEVPTFGVPSQLFKLQPVDLETVINAVSNNERRAALLAQQQIDPDDHFSSKQAVITAITTSL
jgi:hypothetical protein